VTRERGFTLIELLAVMAILAILASVSVVGYQKFQRLAENREVEAQIDQYAHGLIEGEYEVAKGDYPPDDLPSGSRPPNDVNAGPEALLAALAAPGVPWGAPDSKHLGNTDNDKFPKGITTYATPDAFEIVDRYGNPLAYFHCKSYGRKQRIRAKVRDTAEWEDQDVEAVKDPKTGQYFNPDSFQLISAGRDGVFGTDDDLANFEMPQR